MLRGPFLIICNASSGVLHCSRLSTHQVAPAFLYDFRSIFDKTNKSIFVDIIHSNNLGVKIIAKNIYKIIVSQ